MSGIFATILRGPKLVTPPGSKVLILRPPARTRARTHGVLGDEPAGRSSNAMPMVRRAPRWRPAPLAGSVLPVRLPLHLSRRRAPLGGARGDGRPADPGRHQERASESVHACYSRGRGAGPTR